VARAGDRIVRMRDGRIDTSGDGDAGAVPVAGVTGSPG
jgi:hypothetical protein